MGRAPQCEAKHGRSDVLAVDDHAEPCVGALECCGNRSGLAGGEGPHGVKKMGEPRETLCQRRPGLRIGRHRVSEANSNACIDKPGSKSGWYVLGGQCRRSSLPRTLY